MTLVKNKGIVTAQQYLQRGDGSIFFDIISHFPGKIPCSLIHIISKIAHTL